MNVYEKAKLKVAAGMVLTEAEQQLLESSVIPSNLRQYADRLLVHAMSRDPDYEFELIGVITNIANTISEQQFMELLDKSGLSDVWFEITRVPSWDSTEINPNIVNDEPFSSIFSDYTSNDEVRYVGDWQGFAKQCVDFSKSISDSNDFEDDEYDEQYD